MNSTLHDYGFDRGTDDRQKTVSGAGDIASTCVAHIWGSGTTAADRAAPSAGVLKTDSVDSRIAHSG